MKRSRLMRWKDLYEGASMDTTPRLDPLRSSSLLPPYYGLPPLDNLSVGTRLCPKDREDFAARILQREQELQSMRAFLNASAPINQLPVELLVEILSHLQSSANKQAWPDALRVCRHWFVIGSTAATLWRNLKAKGSTNFLRTGLARSRSACLNVEVVDHFHCPLPEVPGLLVPHLHRLRSLALSTVPTASLPAFVDFMENSMPALRSLQVTIVPSDGPETSLALPPARFPQLRELTLSRVQVLHDLAIAPQLWTLDLQDCWGQNPTLTTAMFLETIRQMRRLRKLCLHDVYVLDGDTTGALPGVERVAMDELQVVRVYTEGPLITALLSALIIPPTATALFIENWEGPLPYVCKSFPSDRSGLPILSRVVAAYLSGTYDNHILKGYTTFGPHDENPGIQFVLDMPDAGFEVEDFPISALDGLTNIFRDAPLQSLCIVTVPAAADIADWRAILATFPALRMLDILVLDEEDGTGTPSAKLIFHALDPRTLPAAAAGDTRATSAQDPSHASPDSAAILCPDLRCLHLAGLAAMDTAALLRAIRECLARRARTLGRGKGRFEEITLDLAGHNSQEHFLAMKATFEKALAVFADLVEYRTDDLW